MLAQTVNGVEYTEFEDFEVPALDSHEEMMVLTKNAFMRTMQQMMLEGQKRQVTYRASYLRMRREREIAIRERRKMFVDKKQQEAALMTGRMLRHWLHLEYNAAWATWKWRVQQTKAAGRQFWLLGVRWQRTYFRHWKHCTVSDRVHEHFKKKTMHRIVQMLKNNSMMQVCAHHPQGSGHVLPLGIVLWHGESSLRPSRPMPAVADKAREQGREGWRDGWMGGAPWERCGND